MGELTLYLVINKTTKYIDSIRAEMNQLENLDTKNVEKIKDMFLNEGIGDSLFNQLRQSYSSAIEIAISETTKSRLIKVRDTYSPETKKLFFEKNAPLGVVFILYGIESELLKDAAISFDEDETK